jgi:DNA-binding NarL/FixJ family response regulator
VSSIDRVRVLLADDNNLVRAGIRALLEKLSDVEVIGEARDGNEALELIEKCRTDVALIDIAMPVMDGLELTSRLAKTLPEVRVLILSLYADESFVQGALRAGATGYLLKGAASAELKLALRAVARGKLYLSSQVLAPLFERSVKGNLHTIERSSSRQAEVLRLLAEGKTTKQIALDLNISVKTVESHRAQLIERLSIQRSGPKQLRPA